MAIAALQKILIVAHKSEQSVLLDRLQSEGFVHICPAEQSGLRQDFAELPGPQATGRSSELLRSRLAECINFLQPHAPRPATLRERLAPRRALPVEKYEQTVRQSNADELLGDAQQLRERLGKIDAQADKLAQRLGVLEPWQVLDAPVEGLGPSQRSVILAGMIPNNRDWDELKAELAEAEVAIDTVNRTQDLHYCILAYAQSAAETARHAIHKIDFEPASFEGLTGKPAEIIAAARKELLQLNQQRQEVLEKVSRLAKRVETFGVLHDHFQNLANRDQMIGQALATPSSCFLEGWIRKGDWAKLEAVVAEFSACMVEKTTPAQDEEAPVDLQNIKPFRPFEMITSLYGMPGKKDLDPTPYLAPFFAVFFGLCLTDAGYGLVLLIGALIGLKLLGRGAAKLMTVLAIGGGMAIILGAITNGYFGDGVDKLGWPWLMAMRDYLVSHVGFDPMKSPMTFFALAVILGYFQLMFGLVIALVHNLRQKEFIAALGDQITWLCLLNGILIMTLAKIGMLPSQLAPVFKILAIAAALGLVVGSQREGGIGERLGMGFYNLFSAIFYLGDILSYLRLMALGLVTAGIAMAVNVIAGIAWEIPYVGILAAIIILIGGHLVNLLLSSLSAFVHTLRLQYVEFFPKFFEGGGTEFSPFSRQWKYTKIDS